LRALALSLGALSIPVAATTLLPGWVDHDGALLIWLPAMVPAFILTFYRGWHGASVSLALGMAALTLTQVLVISLGLPVPGWDRIFAIVVMALSLSLGAGWTAELLLRARESAEAEAFHDTLTGLPNRRQAAAILDLGWGATDRGDGLSIIVFDLDLFKDVNDSHGHAEGDRVLMAFGEILAGRTRRSDVSARFGGEEFISILLDCPIDQAAGFAEDVREQFAAIDFGWGRVTTSAGVAAFEEDMASPEDLIVAADRALYTAKEQGRDQVCRTDSVSKEPLTRRESPEFAEYKKGLQQAFSEIRMFVDESPR